MPDLSIICCYNNKLQYDRFAENIKTQSIISELIGIDNIGGPFTSCASAYNTALKQVKTEYVLFSHQDIEFRSRNALESLLQYMKSIGDEDIIGVAGADDKKNIKSNIYTGDSTIKACPVSVEDIEEVQTVDECLFGGKTECFLKYPFDEVVCNGWHLYAVERCLAAIQRGSKVRVCDADVLHKSNGRVDNSFLRNYILLCRKYKKTIKFIYTTCIRGRTVFCFPMITVVKYKLYLLKVKLLRANV